MANLIKTSLQFLVSLLNSESTEQSNKKQSNSSDPKTEVQNASTGLETSYLRCIGKRIAAEPQAA